MSKSQTASKQNNLPPLVSPEEAGLRTVLDVKKLDLVAVSYKDDSGRVVTQLAVAGDNNVVLLESRSLGFVKETTPQGFASNWLRDGILKKLQRK